MEYALTAEVNPPADTPPLDALQRHGVAALLDEHLELLADIEGPEGVEIEPLDHRITVHPGGASITWLLDAPALAFAEDAARQVLGEVLQRTDLLTDWTVGRCEVTATDEDLAAALNGADPADEDDLDGDLSGAIEIEVEAEPVAGLGDVSSAERVAQQAQLLVAAESLGAFGLEAFGYEPDDPECVVSEEAATLAAGAVVAALEVVTEELFADVQTLDQAGTPASEQEVLWLLHELPTRYAAQYTALFAKKFLLTTAVLGYRLAQPEWDGPLSVAEALALWLLRSAARDQLELAGLADDLPVDQMFAVFDEYALEDIDVEALYGDPDEDEAPADDEEDLEQLVLIEWFEAIDYVDEDEVDEFDDEDELDDSDEDEGDDDTPEDRADAPAADSVARR